MEDAIRHISALATFAHHHTVATNHGYPKTWSGMLDHKFTLEAPMRVLEAIVRPADIKSLGRGGCSIWTLHKGLAGTEAGLGCPDTMADVQ
eukprot:8199063-Pyramimonas_sp.AAC.1